MKLLTSWFWLTASLILLSCQQDVEVPPNIVVFLADDLTYRDIGVYGNMDVQTPHLDTLAREGMTFTQAFTGTAMCSPSRQQLYTGLYPVRNGAYPQTSRIRPDVGTVVTRMNDLGYDVAISGKHHFAPKSQYPFEIVGKPEYVELDAIDAFLHEERDRPFLLFVTSRHPHFPWPKSDLEYDPNLIEVPPDLVDTPETRLALARYYHEVTELDAEFGALKTMLDESGLKDETLFMFSSEHGAMFPKAKWTLYDPGIRTALIARWPGRIPTQSTSDALVHYTDVLPTFIDLAKGESAELDGKSFLPVLSGDAETHQTHVFGIHTNRGVCNGTNYPVRSVRTERYKYIWNLGHDRPFINNLTQTDKGGYFESWLEKGEAGDVDALRQYRSYVTRPEEELYDLEEDPFELTNLADDPSLQATKDDLREALDDWMDRQGDTGMDMERQAETRLTPDGLERYQTLERCRVKTD